MPSTDRPDAIAPADPDARLEALPPVANGDVEPGSTQDSDPEQSQPPATSDESGPIPLGPVTTHQLLEPDTAASDRRSTSPSTESPSPQLVSGDPLLRGPASVARPSTSPPKSSTPPPPPTAGPATRVVTTPVEPIKQAADSAMIIPGIGATPTSQPARRAARGAHVTAPRAVVPPTRPPEQPVATLRPTTVAPVPRLAGRRPRVRRVTRVVRHVDPWSVFKVAAAFSVVAYGIALIAGVLLWNVAYATGTIDNIERGMESTGWEVFELDGGAIFHNAWIGGLFAAVAMTGLAVLVATLFNLITDLVGGIRLTVLEEEVIEKTASPLRRFATSSTRHTAPSVADQPVAAQGAEARVRRVRGG